MKRTMSSERPLGALSDAISVTNPYLYWSTSMWRTRSMVSWTAGISSSAAGLRTADWHCHAHGICFQTPPGAASSRGSWDHPGLHRQQALALHFLARELAGAADSFRLLPRFLFRGFLV